MAVWSTVSISALEYSRFDADFYHPTYLSELESWRRLDERIGVARLGRIIAAPVRTGRTPKSRAIKSDEETIRFIKTDTVRAGSVDFNNSTLLPMRVVGERDIIPGGAVVMTIIGATPEIVGRTAIVRSNDPACVTNQNVAVINTKGSFDPFFLTAYFQTKWGRDQVWRHSRRTEQVNLNCREVERVLVPNPELATQVAIGSLVRNSFVDTNHSIKLYERAQQLLEAELGLDKLTIQKPVGCAGRFSTVGWSETVSANRVDAQCFSPDALFYENWLHEHAQCDCLGVLLQEMTKGRQQDDVADGSTDYCSIKHITGRELLQVSKCISQPDSQLAGADDLLLAITGATIGKIGIVKRYKRLAFSGDLLCMTTGNSIDPHYLLLALDHKIGQVQFIRRITGSTNGHLALRDVARVLVPRLNSVTEARIAELVRNSLSKQQESEQLLEQAKAHVESLIEGAIQA
ncbi:MAG: hypothetical protein ABTR92_18965 [Candidatus Accumulibacter phosphatis]|uniref:hypothetical protein n=1 Tax=Candidatus Accumulibacter sp. ACC012 TaxID=2823332 RepID=UPI0025BB04FA|nr:hypothetical protein [Candidatus Accumulibacter sp. ACC012]